MATLAQLFGAFVITFLPSLVWFVMDLSRMQEDAKDEGTIGHTPSDTHVIRKGRDIPG